MSKIFEPTPEREILESYILTRPPGDRLSWMRIETDTGVVMDSRNKEKLRAAMVKHAIEYLPVPNYGIEIAGGHTGTEVVGRRLVRIDNSVKRGERSTMNILQRFRNDMPDDDRRVVEHTAGVFGAIRVYALNAKKAFIPAKDERKRLIASEEAPLVYPRARTDDEHQTV